jgi:RHS repeat-associated protein
MSQNQATDVNGQVTFNLPEQSYKVRADYMGQQYWSGDFTWQNSTITIPKGAIDIHVQRSGEDVPGARVYLFSATSSYLSRNETANESGMVSFLIPSGTYLFRADDSGEQKWSDPATVITDQTVELEINFSDAPIITASADPATILQGETSILTWQTTDAETVTIEPGIGSVNLSDLIELTPSVTTDYTITAQGPGGTVDETVTINVINTPLDVDYGIGDDEQQGGGGLVGETVRIFNGNVIDYRSDLGFASPNSLGLSLGAVYNSRSNSAGTMGFGWTHTYEMSLDPAYDISGMIFLKITDNTGRTHYFTEEQAGEYKGVFGEKTEVLLDSGEYIWKQLDGSKYGFSSTGQITWLDDPSGNRLLLTYDDSLLSTVTDLSSGRVLVFIYNTDNLVDHINGPVTDAVTDGIWVEYGYDTNNNLTSVLYADNSGFDYSYTDTNDIHNLTEKRNKANHLINTWGYDTTDRAISNFSRDGRGADIVYETDTQVEVTDAYGKEREYLLTESNGRNRVSSITDGPGGAGGFPWSNSNAVSWVYDENMNTVEIESAGGIVTQYLNYDERGNPGTVKLAYGEPEEREINFTYHPEISTPLTRTEVSVLQSGGLKETIWDYDDDYNSIPNENPTANVSRIIEKGFTKDISGTVISYEYITTITYNTKGQVILINGPAPGVDDTTTIAYNALTGDVLSVSQPLIGATIYSGYDDAGQVDTVTDVNSQSKTYTYDARGRVTDVTNNANGSVSSVTYNIAGLPEIRTDEDGVGITFEYEVIYGRIFKRFDSQGNYIQYMYDSQGNVIEEGYFDPTDERINRKRYLYQDSTHNMPGQLFREISGDDTYTQYGYDFEGNVSSLREPNGNITYYDFDHLNRIKTVTQPGSINTTYGYDSHGNLISVTDALTNVTTYEYDDMERLVSTTSPDTGTVTYVYDENGKPVNKTDSKGISVGYVYDLLNRLTNVNFPDSSQNITFSYDQGVNGIGKRTGMTDETGSTTFSYDNRGRLTGKSNTVRGITYDLSRVYTLGGRVSQITYPSGRTVDYHRISCMCKVDSITTTYNSLTNTLMQNLEYRPFGGAKALNTGGGGTVGSTFNDAGRMVVSNPGATHEKAYTYDNNGNLTSITAPSLPHHTRVFGYDNLDRLEHAEGPWGIVDYTYDDVGNRLTKTVDSVTETYNYISGSNKLDTVDGTTSYTYDNNGNITNIGNRVLIYNQNNRLIRVEENSTPLGEYTYNALGQRILKEVDSITTVFHYDFDGNIIGESDVSGDFSKEYLYRSSNRLALVDYSADTNGEIYFLGNDRIGTPIILTDLTNTVVWEAVYEPFGNAEINPNSSVECNLRFKGQYYDQESGFHYNYHRYYISSSGRYLTPDPIGLKGSINLFEYVANNPINYIDPLGLEKVTLTVSGVTSGNYALSWAYPDGDPSIVYKTPLYKLTVSSSLGPSQTFEVIRFGPRNKNGKLSVAGLADAQTHELEWFPGYTLHSTNSAENGAWIVYGNFLLHDGPDDFNEAFGTAGCLEVVGKEGFSKLKDAVLKLSGEACLCDVDAIIIYKAAKRPPLSAFTRY